MPYKEVDSGCPFVRSFRKVGEALRVGEFWLWTYGFDGTSLLEYASPAVKEKFGVPYDEQFDVYLSVAVGGFPLLGMSAVRTDCVGTVFNCVSDVSVPMVEQDRAKATALLLDVYREREQQAERELQKSKERVARLEECGKAVGADN